METLETARLRLRPWRLTDAEDLFAYARDPHVGPAAGWKPHESVEESRAIALRFIQEEEVWAMELKETGAVIGSVGLHADSKRPGIRAKMIGYVLAREYWGRGLMTEAVTKVIGYAFVQLKLDLLSVNHFGFNIRSRRVIEKCGFHYEGTLRMAVKRYDGVILDDVCYSMVRGEYERDIAFRKFRDEEG